MIGLTTPEILTKAYPRKVGGYSFNEIQLAKILQSEIEKLKSENVDYIIGLAHLGIDEESVLYRSKNIINQVSSLHIFIGGYSYSTVENKEVKGKGNNDKNNVKKNTKQVMKTY